MIEGQCHSIRHGISQPRLVQGTAWLTAVRVIRTVAGNGITLTYRPCSSFLICRNHSWGRDVILNWIRIPNFGFPRT